MFTVNWEGSTSILLTRTEDGTDQYIWQYENELGLPWESPESYLRMSYPFLHADRIKTPTLFMCGEKDFNVPLIKFGANVSGTPQPERADAACNLSGSES